MALRNRTDHETDRLKGVVLSSDPAKLEFGRFVRLENFIPGELTSLKKKRGVVALTSTEITPDTPTPCA